MAKGLTVSIDGGATSTDLLLLQRSLSSGVIVSGKGSNPNVTGKDCLDELDRLIHKATLVLGVSRDDVDEVVAGMAGRGNPQNRLAFQEKLDILFPHAHILQINDSELAHRGIWGTNAGITILSGTGSVGIGTDEKGHIYFTGGLGHKIGDEGSGYWLVKTALMELITKERSLNDDDIQLRNALVKHFGFNDYEELLTELSGDETPPPVIASGTPVILNAAENGNMVANHLVRRGADYLADLIIELYEKMNKQKGELKLGCTGSVIKKSLFYRKCMEISLSYEFNSVEWVVSAYLPVYGGLVLSSSNYTPVDFEHIEVQFV
ncbi:MAG: BadF/BadG/BcrA/BcrD ATPase family protein [Fidelibacterota bacterium]